MAWTCFNNCDLAVDGSPTKQMLISLLNLPLPSKLLWVPPNICASKPFLIFLWPEMELAKLSIKSSMMFYDPANSWNFYLYSEENKVLWSDNDALKRFSYNTLNEIISVNVENTVLRSHLDRLIFLDWALKRPTISTRSPGRIPLTLLS